MLKTTTVSKCAITHTVVSKYRDFSWTTGFSLPGNMDPWPWNSGEFSFDGSGKPGFVPGTAMLQFCRFWPFSDPYPIPEEITENDVFDRKTTNFSTFSWKSPKITNFSTFSTILVKIHTPSRFYGSDPLRPQSAVNPTVGSARDPILQWIPL